MRRQHEMVAFAAPSYMITKSAPVGCLALFPLDRYIFVESGHALPPGRHSIPGAQRIKKKPEYLCCELYYLTQECEGGAR
jgi:hypothetical protein